MLMDVTTTLPSDQKKIEGLINVNTAPRLVLETIEGLSGEQIEMIALHQEPDEMSAYERLIDDAIHAQSGLFARVDEVETAWKVIDPVMADLAELEYYDGGTWGPESADQLTGSLHCWHNPLTPVCPVEVLR